MDAEEIAARLRWVAQSRRDGYGHHGKQWQREEIDHECTMLELAAQIAEGELNPLYCLLPAWFWTDEMNADLEARSHGR